MKIIKKISAVLLVILLSISSFKISKVEASSVSFSASAGEVTVGTTVTLTASVTAGSWNLSISGNGVSKSLVGQTDVASNKTASVSASFTPQAEGSYTFNLTGDVTDFDTEVNENISRSVTVKVNPKPTTTSTPQQGETTSKPKTTMPSETKANNNKTETTKSSNNYLSALSIVGEGATLSPEFYRETYEYTVEYGEEVNLYELTEIELEAKAEDNRATVKGAGKITLEEGENSIPITVTAENGTERTYTIKVVKPKKVEQSELRLQTLVLNGIKKDGTYQTIDFELDPENFEYNLQVPNDIKGISVNPTTENEDIIIEKVGNEDLGEGENKIEITLTSPSDKEVTTTYVLKIQREAAPVEETLNNNQQMYMIAGGIGILILLIIIILIVIHRKKKKKSKSSEFEEFGLDEEDSVDNKSEDEMDYKMQSMQYVNPQKEVTVDDVEVPELRWEEEKTEETVEEIEEVQEVEKEDKKKKKKTGRRFL